MNDSEAPRSTAVDRLRSGSRLGKYRILRRISVGGFASVYAAQDTIEGIQVAVKVLHSQLVTPTLLAQYRHEARVHAGLDHPNILPVKNADWIDERFLIVSPLGIESLHDRLQRTLSVGRFVDYARQMLEAVAHAHAQKVIHCDIKPENFIVFPGNRLRLADFGIAKIASPRTMPSSGSGTVGYVAPEQALGRAAFRSDVFSLGLVFYFMLSRRLPEWPFAWPPPGIEAVRRKVPPEFRDFLRRAIEVDQGKRYRDAQHQLTAFERVLPKLKNKASRQRRKRSKSPETATNHDWKAVRFRQFERRYKLTLTLDRACRKCSGPISEPMQACPWCSHPHVVKRTDTSPYPCRCPRCHRGRKLDWASCAWCFGPKFVDVSDRTYTDRRYTARCSHCRSQQLVPFTRYCPGCRRRVARKWSIQGSAAKCKSCGWGVVPEFWSHCPWCTKPITSGQRNGGSSP